jgi:hypothetical protein
LRLVIIDTSKLVIFLLVRRDQGSAQAALSWIRVFGVHANEKIIMNNDVIEFELSRVKSKENLNRTPSEALAQHE